MSVVVFGSINMDLVARVAQLPRPGETLTGRSFSAVPGGKGANQAVACARLGTPTHMIGAVGDDVFGVDLVRGLQTANVNTSYVATVPETSSGLAQITVNDQGANTIIVIPGANAFADVAGLAALAGEGLGQILLLQLEINLTAVQQAAVIAKQRGMFVMLDPAPACPLPDDLLRLVDLLTPNQTEAEILTGISAATPDGARQAGQHLIEKGVERVIVKMGEQGAYYLDRNGHRFYPAPVVKAIDTVAAGDAFNGGIAAALDRGLPFAQAIGWGLAAGALCVTKSGAQDSMPTLSELRTFFDIHPEVVAASSPA